MPVGRRVLVAPALRREEPEVAYELIRDLKLLKSRGWCYEDTAAYGHFGRDCFPWERLDRVAKLKKFLGR